MAKLLWTQKQDIGPAARSRFDMVYDSSRSRVVLFGGQTGNAGTNDTWEWNGEEWTQIADIGPSPRFRHALAYDSNRNCVVLFGGGTGQSVLGDTWEWDGEYWTQIDDTGPAARTGHAMCFDTTRQRVLLFGGMNQANAAFGDTWAWDGNEWTQEQDTGPSARSDHKLVYDSARDHVVLFGGSTTTTYTYSVETSSGLFGSSYGATYKTVTGYNYNYFNDTWECDAAQWTRVADTGPNPCSAYGMVYNGEEALLFGGQGSSGVYGNTWTWDGKYWTQRQDIGPAARSFLGMAYDRARQRAVLFGGANPNQFGDTWEQFERPEPTVNRD